MKPSPTSSTGSAEKFLAAKKCFYGFPKWKQVFENLQAKKEYSWGDSSVWLDETCSRNPRLREFETRRNAARRGRPERMGCSEQYVNNSGTLQVPCNNTDDPCSVPAVDFFNQINMLYGTITEFCTEESCPIMSAGPKYEYHWADGHTVKKPIKCSAPKYIDYLMTWVQDQLDDETLFPSKIGNHYCYFK